MNNLSPSTCLDPHAVPSAARALSPDRLWRRLSLVCALLSLLTASTFAQNFYVDPNSGSDQASQSGSSSAPWRSISYAQSRVRTTISGGMSQDVTVHLRNGTYYLTSTINFTSQDSGRNGYTVRYRAESGATPVVSGGKKITGTWSDAGGGKRRINIGTSDRFRQLYVGSGIGSWTTRARTPNEGGDASDDYYKTTGYPGPTYQIASSQISNWANLTSVEFVVQKSWNISRLPITGYTVSESTATVSFEKQAGYRNQILGAPFNSAGLPYHFENALEFVDQPGEWYHNWANGELTYLPRAGESMGTTDVHIPSVTTLFAFDGANNMEVRGLTLAHTNYTDPSVNGFIGTQGGTQYPADGQPAWAPGAVTIRNGSALTFTANRFQDLGGSGLVLEKNTTSVVIEGNIFKDIASNGISLHTGAANPVSADRVRTTTIRNNAITYVARDFWGSVGINAGQTVGTTIANNEIGFLPQGGINSGDVNITTVGVNGGTGADVNVYEKNYIHDLMQRLDDNAAIYNYGYSGGTIVRDNCILGVKRSYWGQSSPIAAVYLDQGSKNYTVSGNVRREVDLYFNINTGGGTPASLADNSVGTNFYADSVKEAAAGPQDSTSYTRITPASSKPVTPTALSRTNWSFATPNNPSMAPRVKDGDMNTEWQSGNTRNVQTYFQIDLGASPSAYSRIVLESLSASSTNDQLEDFAVYLNDSDSGWDTVAATYTGFGSKEHLEILLPNPSQKRYIRIKQTAQPVYSWYWRIDELNVYSTPGNGGSSAPVLANSGFETSNVGTGNNGYKYNTDVTGSSWTFNGGSGIAHRDSAWGIGTGFTGDYVAFLQNTGYFAQEVTFTAGTYRIRFKAARRTNSGGNNPIKISVGGVQVGTGTYLPSNGTFQEMTSADFTVTAGAKTVRFEGTSTGGDNTVFIDDIIIDSVGGPTATYVSVDATTQGTWKGVYGAGGYSVSQDSQSLPSYVSSLTFASKSDWTWASAPTENRATQRGGTGRIAGVWYSGSQFDVTINVTAGTAKQVVFYCLDWDDRSRAQTIQPFDASTGGSLATAQTLAAGTYRDGRHVVYNVKGNVRFRFTRTGGDNAVLSGIFFGN